MPIPDTVLICPRCKARTHFTFSWTIIEGAPNAHFVSPAQCVVCKTVVLAYANQVGHVVQYFPPPEAWFEGDSSGTPAPIWADFSEASVCRSVNAFKAVAVLCRRAVQGVAIEKGIPKGTPREQIDEMEKRRLITPLVRDTAHQIRVFGNVGAHPGEDGLDVVLEAEADAALTFTEELLDHIYRLPARLARFAPPAAT